MSEDNQYTLLEAHQEFAKRANHRVWDLLEQSTRTAEEDEELILAASASLYHWLQAGGAVQSKRGHWLLSRVYVVLGRVQDALDLALKCGSITESHLDEMEDFDLAFAQESLARAYALAGDFMQADEHLKAAEKLGQAIKDAKDQEIFLGDLNSGDWYGIKKSLLTLPSQKSCGRLVSQTYRADCIFHFLCRSQNLSMISHSR